MYCGGESGEEPEEELLCVSMESREGHPIVRSSSPLQTDSPEKMMTPEVLEVSGAGEAYPPPRPSEAARGARRGSKPVGVPPVKKRVVEAPIEANVEAVVAGTAGNP